MNELNAAAALLKSAIAPGVKTFALLPPLTTLRAQSLSSGIPTAPCGPCDQSPRWNASVDG
eukprot:CAMPEP_0169112328 /NCGR_PEP_ID=MMETSP1015-20121227/27580_1 /TAXON_ID=342587 /ORGANISM="Karlodinium micrum, Strain CCMP2283" /LENGTH=60 /DNA_ID=CAMNT_0009174365 /DNA_START=114 /DNA_END=296 /DNA_ORIENTATION=-